MDVSNSDSAAQIMPVTEIMITGKGGGQDPDGTEPCSLGTLVLRNSLALCALLYELPSAPFFDDNSICKILHCLAQALQDAWRPDL
eukprot:CAMPEP_0174372902 /NCGR_PEP_ID=MMETSP0811_2-20130205/105087_1 /TAXON_ID=73025 ORGANISM="Eutreptiella gymnastica-like, Strain CCMP1594" /NCGR_SAMPLE_ID=MMETSP0811_2 /ASSEMBLY_ACC=CAM_ASM_000667 /LENGTH=85 /DNA_ID=CAMNT_0015520701 /DNA_START=140 /DNA_END=398 /DNA_ORIENTATION=-